MDQTPTSADHENVEPAELAAEQQHVDRVYDRVAEAARSASRIAVEGHQRAQAQNVGRVREEEQTGLYERDVLVFAAARRIAELDAEHEGLVFGRLDSDHGDDEPAVETAADLDKLYVGRIGVRDAEYEPLVIDWRAPAAEPFYRATSTDRLKVVRRRVLRNKGPRIVGLEDDLLAPERAPEDLPVMGEGALMASLSRARGHTMRDIVATIQAEQDKAIRAPARGVTVIGGGPGTGKTVVALHRAAYLLYSDRRRFERGGVLVVGPSAAFMAYIERVLPSLGENTVSLRAVGELVDGVKATAVDEADVAAVKGSLRMRGVLSRAARDRVPTAPATLRVFIGGATVELDANQLDNVRRNALRRTPRNKAATEARKALVAALWQRFPDDLRTGVYGDREAFGDRVVDTPAFRTFFSQWWPVLTPEAVLRWLGDPRRLQRWARNELTPREVDALARAIRSTDEFTIADVALLDELSTLLGRAPVNEAKDDEFDWLEGLSDGVNEVLTTSERRARAAAPGGRRAGGVRARAGGRGTGPVPDAVADGDPARSAGELDDRRRPGAELVARSGRGAGGDGLDAVAPATALVPAVHQLPELGRDLRVRRRGDPAVRSRTPICRTRSAAPVSTPSTGSSTTARSPRPRVTPRSSCSSSSRARSA